MIPSNALIAAHQFLAPILSQARCVVDATAGNGKDTLFLCQHTPPDCRIVAIDIQQVAIRSATDLIARHGYQEKIRWVHGNHAQMADHVTEPVDAAIFNLGYLPGQDHTITTVPVAVGPALSGLLELLVPGGRIALVAYPGHGSGRAEIEFLNATLTHYPQQLYVTTRLSFINQCNHPAVLYTIGKARRNPHENSSAN